MVFLFCENGLIIPQIRIYVQLRSSEKEQGQRKSISRVLGVFQQSPRALGVVFSLTGIAVIILVLDRLSFTKAAYRMASFIRKGEG